MIIKLLKIQSYKNKPKITKETLPATTDQAEKPILSRFQKKEKYMVRDGPQLYVSILLNKRGPLTAKQIWREAAQDPEQVEKKILKNFVFFKLRILERMVAQGKIVNAGYSQITNTYLGYKVIPKKAFKNVHPDILEKLDPKPDLGKTVHTSNHSIEDPSKIKSM